MSNETAQQVNFQVKSLADLFISRPLDQLPENIVKNRSDAQASAAAIHAAHILVGKIAECNSKLEQFTIEEFRAPFIKQSDELLKRVVALSVAFHLYDTFWDPIGALLRDDFNAQAIIKYKVSLLEGPLAERAAESLKGHDAYSIDVNKHKIRRLVPLAARENEHAKGLLIEFSNDRLDPFLYRSILKEILEKILEKPEKQTSYKNLFCEMVKAFPKQINHLSYVLQLNFDKIFDERLADFMLRVANLSEIAHDAVSDVHIRAAISDPYHLGTGEQACAETMCVRLATEGTYGQLTLMALLGKMHSDSIYGKKEPEILKRADKTESIILKIGESSSGAVIGAIDAYKKKYPARDPNCAWYSKLNFLRELVTECCACPTSKTLPAAAGRGSMVAPSANLAPQKFGGRLAH